MNSLENKPSSFEEQLAMLEQLADKMENGHLSLEDTLDAYGKGMELVKNLSRQLDQAEKKIAEISGEQIIPLEEDRDEQQDIL